MGIVESKREEKVELFIRGDNKVRKIKTKTARVCLMVIDDCINCGVLNYEEAYNMMKKHVFGIKQSSLRNDAVYPPFYKQKKYK